MKVEAAVAEAALVLEVEAAVAVVVATRFSGVPVVVKARAK